VEFLGWQWLGIATTVAISQTIAAIGFPVLIIALIPLRWLFLPTRFTLEELHTLDAPTADNDVVLASLGGKPEWRGTYGESQDDVEDHSDNQLQRRASRQRAGSYERKRSV